MLTICWRISSVAFAVWLARLFTSEATTANPRPASPARAASMVALSASRLVCEAMVWIRSTTTLMRPALSASPCMVASVAPASSTALRAISAEVTTWRPISSIEDDSSSVPDGHGLHVDRGFLGGGGHRAHQRAGLIGGRRHALRGGLHRAGRSSAGCRARCGRWFRIRRSGLPCGRRARPWRCGPCPGRRSARGPRSCSRGTPAANWPSPRSRRAGWTDRSRIRGRRRTAAASSAAGCGSGAGCCRRHRARRTGSIRPGSRRRARA